MEKWIAIALIFAIMLTGCKLQVEEGVVVEIGDKTWVAEIADTPAEQEQGLMFRKSLPQNQGMLFIFEDEQPRAFWMKNTLIPLDMIFIDANWRIVKLIKNAEPCKEDPCPTYDSERPAKYVLEVNAGQIKEKEVKVGARVQTSLKQ